MSIFSLFKWIANHLSDETVFFLPALGFLVLGFGLVLLFVIPQEYRVLFWTITVTISWIVLAFCTILGFFYVTMVIKRNGDVHRRKEQNE